MIEKSVENPTIICSECRNPLPSEDMRYQCSDCQRILCENCAYSCQSCDAILCTDCASICENCNERMCLDCSRECSICQKSYCETCSDDVMAKCGDCEEMFCEDCGTIIEEGSIEDDKFGMESSCANCNGYRKKRHRHY